MSFASWLILFGLFTLTLSQIPDFDEHKLSEHRPMIAIRRLRDSYFLRSDIPAIYKDDMDETYQNLPNEIMNCHYKEIANYEECVYMACEMARKIFEEIEEVARERAEAKWEPK